MTQSAVREIALQVFRHLHGLSLRFHLERQTGGMSRDIERGTRGIQSLISYSLYSILPTLVEMALVMGFFIVRYDIWFAGITAVALAGYIVFTVVVTEWRTHFRRRMNELDSRANQKAIDSLLNFETVKYFGNEEYEARRYDENLRTYRTAAIRSQNSLSFLNFGQQAIIAVGLILILWRATVGVAAGRLTLGDLVLVNTLMIQLYIPLNFLGVIYREIKQATTDMDRMFVLLGTNQEVADAPGAPALRVAGAEVRFRDVGFGYERDRTILDGVDFTIAAGTTTAVVGHSGSGKSTLARLLFRFYDVGAGAIRSRRPDIRAVSQDSLRRAIGIVPQDTVLFNDSIYYNIAYGRPEASHDEVIAAARAAQIDTFIRELPQGYDTPVGERGLKLSGGEAARGDRAHAAEEPAHPGLRRGDLRARFAYRAGDPGRADALGAGPHHAADRAPPLHRGACGPDPHGPWPHRRAWHPCRTDARRRPLCGNVEIQARSARGRGRRGLRRGRARHRGRRRDAGRLSRRACRAAAWPC